jgi:antitoxin (DNA-binding transcriptional repressor) of toxin-antitoxin stability system
MLTKKLDIQQISISIIDLLALVQNDTEIVLTDGDMPLAKVTPIDRFQENIAPKAGLNSGAMVMSDNFDEPLPDEFWLQ